MKIVDILHACAEDDYKSQSCIEFIVDAFHIPTDNWDSHITILLQRMQVINDLTNDDKKIRDMLITCLDKFQRCLRQLHVFSAEEFRNFLQRSELKTNSFAILLKNLEYLLVKESADIQSIAASLAGSIHPSYLLGYTSITSRDIFSVPAGIKAASGCITPEVNVGIKNRFGNWIFSLVTSNLNEDILAGKDCKHTTMKPRNRLYPIFTRISSDNMNNLRKLIPNYDDTCIPALKCTVVPLV